MDYVVRASAEQQRHAPPAANRKRITSDRLNFDPPTFEYHHPILEGEQGVIFAPADKPTGLERCSALPNDNRTDFGFLAAVQLHTAILRIAVPPVSR
jgi:hypothetical protein